MCAQDRSNSHLMFHTHQNAHLTSPTRKPALTRMPKSACLATAVRFTRTLPTVSARVPSHTVSQPTQAPSVRNTVFCNQHTATSLKARPALAVSNDPTCQHRRSHAFVQGRWIPFCLRCGDSQTQPTQTQPVCNTTLCIQIATPSLNPRPALSVSNDPTCRHRRSHAFVQGRWIPFCLSCGDDKKTKDPLAVACASSVDAKTRIAVGARSVLETMHGFPYDLRRSPVEAGRLME